ncbi:hypothetical protein CK203_061499 [Vitis vinifera]|uniref:Ubiquitin-like protease family profile domain-containing protein n=1 Tax=Vitis vinifera TaxID=29760 RepID=A0A438GFU8_VITVI|nr:hypothetical protein CK203_061499 [Vitis vinifera]
MLSSPHSSIGGRLVLHSRLCPRALISTHPRQPGALSCLCVLLDVFVLLGVFGSERDGLAVVRNPKRPIGAWIHYYNDQLAMMKEKDKGVKINDDLYLQTRCSPEQVIRVIENLEPKQKAAIEEIGFGSLLQLRYIDSIKKMNWAEFVLSYLVHGIEEFKKKQQSGVCGCLLFLMLFYHEHISFEEKFLPLYTRPSPRITAWGDDEVLDRKRRLKKLGGYANEDLKIWVIENEIRDCVDGNATTMASENEDDEIFVSNLNKDVIKRVDGGKLMEMDKTFQQLKTHLLDMAYGASSSSCDKILAKFEENYTQVKGLFLRSSGKPLRMHEEGTKNDMLSCERSLEDTNNMNVNEHYLHTLSNEKLCTEDLNEKNEDACATSIEVHIIPDENENILPLRRDYGKEPLRALCGYPNHVMKTRSSRERKPSKFKVSPFVQKSRKMVKREASESIPMSIRKDVVDTQSFNVLQSLVADYVFNKALSKSELLVDFGHEHGVRGDFACLCPRQNLMDVLFIPMHDECPGHWYLCVIDFKNSHTQILDSLRSKNRDKFRFQSVKTVVEFCQTFFKLSDIGKDVFQFSIDWAPSIPTQENGWDCGVHVIRHMQRFKMWQPGEDGHQPVEKFVQPDAYIVSQLQPWLPDEEFPRPVEKFSQPVATGHKNPQPIDGHLLNRLRICLTSSYRLRKFLNRSRKFLIR